MNLDNILNKETLDRNDIAALLGAEGEVKQQLFDIAASIKSEYVGNWVYFRGLIELSNKCAKNCFYCGIRAANKNCTRYELTDEEVLEAARYISEHDFGSMVMQAGERNDKAFVNRIDTLLKKIAKQDPQIGITLSLGEQTEETYIRWRESGATRYLLRIETSNRYLYSLFHPNDADHNFNKRQECLHLLRKLDYQTGTGVMIGLPHQTLHDLADDILFMQSLDIDMVGMGPYIENKDTPMYEYVDELMPLQERFDLTLKMIATLRIVMKDINIASTTALQTIDSQGREKGLKVGANIIMPNITPVKYHGNYALYHNKPTVNELTDEYVAALERQINAAGDQIGYGKLGTSKHYKLHRN